MEDVAEVLSADAGENDGETWVCVVKLVDGRFGFLEAGCDYTGWDCQAGGRGFVKDKLEDLQRWDMNSSARRRLGMELEDLDKLS